MRLPTVRLYYYIPLLQKQQTQNGFARTHFSAANRYRIF